MKAFSICMMGLVILWGAFFALPAQAQEAEDDVVIIRNITDINTGMLFRRGVGILSSRMLDMEYRIETKDWGTAKLLIEGRMLQTLQSMRTAVPRPAMRAYIGIINFEKALKALLAALETGNEADILAKYKICDEYFKGLEFHRSRRF